MTMWNRNQLVKAHSWTDDLPVCHLSGVGLSTNQIYREDGYRREEHEFEDRSFHFKLENGTFLYGVFDGHDGSRASNFAAQRMPAELLLGQLNDKTTNEAIKMALHQAIIAVEKGFFESIDDLLAEKANLQLQLPEDLSSYDAYVQYPEMVNRLQALEIEICGGTTAVVALVHNNKLYVANVGDSRALLCKQDNEGVLRVVQLSLDHDISNEDELLRLSQLGLDVDKIRQGSKLGNQENTRCLGNYMVKGGYKDFDILSVAQGEPVIAEPEIHGGILLEESSCSFFLLMSDGLYKSLEDATGTEYVNRDIASMVATEFAIQSTLNGVAQAVVDRVVRIHHDTFMSGNERARTCQKRDDITLLVRNFNYPLPNALSSPTVGSHFSPLNSFLNNHNRLASPPSLVVANNACQSSSSPQTPTSGIKTPNFPSPVNTNQSEINQAQLTRTSTYTSQLSYATQSNYTSSTDSDERQLFQRPRLSNQLPLDEEGRIQPYVDFTDFYKAVEEAHQQGMLSGEEKTAT